MKFRKIASFILIFTFGLFLVSCNNKVYEINYFIGDDIYYTIQSTDSNSAILPPEPIKKGFLFSGWFHNPQFTGEKIVEIGFEVTENIKLYAKWEPIEYEIVYELNGGVNELNPKTYTVETDTIKLNDPIKEGYTFIGWYENDSYLGKTINEITLGSTENLKLYAKWEVNQYTISFNSNGGSEVVEIQGDYGSLVVAPEPPTKDWYIFEGWYLEDELLNKYTFDTIQSKNITLYAKWEPIEYEIVYELNGGVNELNPKTYTVETDTIKLNDPIKEGYTFIGWYENDSYLGKTINEITLGSTENLKLYAKWEVNQYTISFNSNGGSEVVEIQGDYGSLVVAPEPPTKDWYIFEGWYLEDELLNKYTFDTIQSKNITLYAKWEPIEYEIVYELNGGVNELNPKTYTVETDTIKLNDPIKEGYTFIGWYENDSYLGKTINEITLGSTENLKLYAKWEVNQYTISFNSNGGSEVVEIQGDYGSLVVAPEPPTKDWYIFEGWYLEDELLNKYTFDTIQSKNITLYAKFLINKKIIKPMIEDAFINSGMKKYDRTIFIKEVSSTDAYAFNLTSGTFMYMLSNSLTDLEIVIRANGSYETDYNYSYGYYPYYYHTRMKISGLLDSNSYNIDSFSSNNGENSYNVGNKLKKDTDNAYKYFKNILEAGNLPLEIFRAYYSNK